MRAVQTPRAVAVPAENAIPSLVRALLALVAIAALMLVSSPMVIHAQASGAATSPPQTAVHTVQAGETLWSLAARFYGDGHKWHELARLNDLGENAEKGLTVGQVLKVPARKGQVAEVAKPTAADAAAQKIAAEKPKPEKPAAGKPAGGGALASQTAGKADASPKAPSRAPAKVATTSPVTKTATDNRNAAANADSTKFGAVQQPSTSTQEIVPERRVWSVEGASMRAARGKDNATIFQGQVYDRDDIQAVTAQMASTAQEIPRARTGEFEAAPFPLAQSQFNSGSTIGRRVGASAAGSSRDADRLVIADEAEIQLSAGSDASVGARYVAVTMGEEIAPGIRLAVPTGVLQIVRADAGKAVVARVARQSGMIVQGEYLIAQEGAPAPAGAKAVAIGGTGGPETRVLWVRRDELLPSLQSYLVLAATDKDGIMAGDEFWLVSKLGVGADAREQRIAVARVVRVTSAGSTAIIVQQDAAAISEGVVARRVAKVN